MIKNNKKYFGIFLSVFLIFTVVSNIAVFAYDIPKASNQFYVNDFADILSEETEKYIVSVNDNLYAKTGAQVVVTTIQSLNGASLEEYATEMFRTYGIGSKKKNNGVLLLLALEDRACRIEVGYGLEGALNDAKTGRFQDDYMIPYFRDGKWDEGMKNGFDAFIAEISKEYAVEIESDSPTALRAGEHDEEASWDHNDTMGIIAGAVALVIGIIMGRLMRKLWIGLALNFLVMFIGHLIVGSVLADILMLIAYFIGFIAATPLVDVNSSGGSGGFGGGSDSGGGFGGFSGGFGGSSGGFSGGGSSGGGGSSRHF